MASISSVITGGFGPPGSASLVITDGYGIASEVAVVVSPPGGGKRRRKVIRFSDFERREEYERALRIAAQPILEAPIPMSALPPVDEDEEVVFKILMLMHDE